ncbi:MAG: hypothetical protein ABI321_17945 [Polyangia bacterium]
MNPAQIVRASVVSLGVLALGVLAVGCTAPTAMNADTTGSAAGALLPGGASDPLAAMFEDRARLGSSGIVDAKWGGTYHDTLGYSLPDDGAPILDGFIDRVPDLNIPDGYWTEMSVFRLHKRADQVGILHIELGKDDVAVRMARRDVGSNKITSAWIDAEYPVDYGSLYAEADYVIMVAPGRSATGRDTFSYKNLTFTLETE